MQSSSITTCSGYPHENYGQGKLKRITTETREIVAKTATKWKCIKLDMKGPNLNICKRHSTTSGSRRGAMEMIGVFFNQSPGCRQGIILAPKPVAWLLLPGSGAFGLETFWLKSATSESLRDS